MWLPGMARDQAGLHGGQGVTTHSMPARPSRSCAAAQARSHNLFELFMIRTPQTKIDIHFKFGRLADPSSHIGSGYIFETKKRRTCDGFPSSTTARPWTRSGMRRQCRTPSLFLWRGAIPGASLLLAKLRTMPFLLVCLPGTCGSQSSIAATKTSSRQLLAFSGFLQGAGRRHEPGQDEGLHHRFRASATVCLGVCFLNDLRHALLQSSLIVIAYDG